jgi:hypothetical protein
MSAPVLNDTDKHVMYAPPWARESPQQPPQASAAAIDIEAAMADMVDAAWTPPPLDPVTMPDPPRPRLGGPTLAMVARLGGAVAFAAAVALFLTGAIPLPSIDISLHASEGARAASTLVQALGVGDTRESRPAPLRVADASPSAASQPNAPQATGLPFEVLTAFASLDAAAAVPATTQALSAARIDTAPEATATVATRPLEQRVLDVDELEGLFKRAQVLLGEGDISSARLLLRRAAEAGDANAALALAGTYDRGELAKLKVIGVVHDNAQAKLWYTKAVALGSAEAMRRLQQLAQRAD